MSALQSTATASQPSLAHFFDTIQGYQRAFILKAAVDLDVFTLIAKGNQTVAQIAKTCNVPERGIRVICDCLTVMGFLNKNGNRYSVTSDSAMFLDSRSPAYMGKALRFLLDPSQLERMQQLTESVRKGAGAGDPFIAADDDRLWVEFARGMAPMMVPAAETIAQVLRPALAAKTSAKILDVAAGHGIFGITVAEHFQNAEIYALDSANVLKVAEENASAHGVRARYHLLPGSAFDVSWGKARWLFWTLFPMKIACRRRSRRCSPSPCLAGPSTAIPTLSRSFRKCAATQDSMMQSRCRSRLRRNRWWWPRSRSDSSEYDRTLRTAVSGSR
jgi:predicted transcriptional regulator